MCIFIVAYYAFHSVPINVSKLVMLEPFNSCCNGNIVAVQSEQCCISSEPIESWYSHTIDGCIMLVKQKCVETYLHLHGRSFC